MLSRHPSRGRSCRWALGLSTGLTSADQHVRRETAIGKESMSTDNDVLILVPCVCEIGCAFRADDDVVRLAVVLHEDLVQRKPARRDLDAKN